MRSAGMSLILICSLACLIAGSAVADSRRDGDQVRDHVDTHYGHNQRYIDRGVAVSGLPREAIAVRAGAEQYYLHGGVWYRPEGRRFVVVAPPRGVFVPALPVFYTTLLIGGLTYYYANDTYYAWRDDSRQYEVVDAPENADSAAVVSSTAPLTGNVFIYPNNGQSADQQTQDRYECYRWAGEQTGFDPALGDPANAKRDDYKRALSACLEARGYTVR